MQIEIDEDEYNELHQLMVKYQKALIQCRNAIQGYKDTNKLNEEIVLNLALVSAKIALEDL